ncbi:MAG: RNA polymerase sigma factor [Solirubrobacteraceae bacterium]
MRWSEASDEALLGATPSEPDAFAELYDRYESALVGFLLRRTGNVEVAVDLASEVFAAALTGAHRYRPAPGRTAAAWLFTIAQNILRDSLRRGRVEARARRRIGIRDAVAYGEDELERIEALASQTDWATRLLESLPDEQREAVRARVLGERSYDEIASDLRTSELVVRKRVSRGLAALRKRMEETA